MDFAGDLILRTGIEDHWSVNINGTLTGTGSIDLSDAGVAASGSLAIIGGGAGDIVSGGLVSGIVAQSRPATATDPFPST